MRLNKRFKKWTSFLSVLFLLLAQPVWASPFLPQELEDDETPQGFVDAERAEETHQRQQREVDQMRSIFEEPAKLDATKEESLLSKFQKNDAQTEESLEANSKEGEEGDAVSDLALLQSSSVPLSHANVEAEAEEPVDSKTDSTTTDTETGEENEPQAVAMAEVEEAHSAAKQEAEDTVHQLAAQAATTATNETPNNSNNNEEANVTIEKLVSEDPVVLAGLSVLPPQDVVNETFLEEAEEVGTQAVSKSNSAVAAELAALMGVHSVGTAVSGSESVGVAESALIDPLPQTMSAPPQPFLQQDPPAILFPSAPIDPNVSIFDPGEDGTGGVTRVGTVFAAFKQFFQDLNTGNGQVIGNGISDGAETFSEFVEFLAFIYKNFFGIEVNAGELKELFLNGTTAQGVQLFGSANIFLNSLIVSAFFLQTSDFFPGQGRQGVDLDLLRGDNPDAFTFSIPFILPDYLVTALGQAISDNPNITSQAANALGLTALNEMFAQLFTVTLTLQPGNGFFIVDPNNLANIQAFMSQNTLDFDQNVERFITVNFISADQAEFDPALLAFMQNAQNQNKGLAGFFKITIDKETLNFIGDLMVQTFLANLGPALDFYKSLGFETGVGPNTPFIFSPGLFTLRGGVNQEFQGVKSGMALAVLQMLFATGFSFLTLFGMAPPVPDNSTMLTDTDSFKKNVDRVFFSNAQDTFEESEEEVREAQDKAETKEKSEAEQKAKEKKKGEARKNKAQQRGAAVGGKK